MIGGASATSLGSAGVSSVVGGRDKSPEVCSAWLAVTLKSSLKSSGIR